MLVLKFKFYKKNLSLLGKLFFSRKKFRFPKKLSKAACFYCANIRRSLCFYCASDSAACLCCRNISWGTCCFFLKILVESLDVVGHMLHADIMQLLVELHGVIEQIIQ
jgi:hypothetical protein